MDDDGTGGWPTRLRRNAVACCGVKHLGRTCYPARLSLTPILHNGNMGTRKPTHAGSWYTDNGPLLSQQLDGWLEAVPSSTTPIGAASSQQGQVSIPTPIARAIIAP